MLSLKKLQFPQKIGYLWFRLFDPTGYLFYLLKDRLFVVRLAFYALFSFCFFGVSYFLFKIQLFNYLIEYHDGVALVLSNALFVSVFSSSLFLPFYESLYKLDIQDLKDRKNSIKVAKAQWWRLRNMSIYFRFLIYSIGWFIGMQIVYLIALFSFSELYTITFSTSGGLVGFTSEKELEQFSALFSDFIYTCVSIWSIFVFVLLLFFEYRVRKIKKTLAQSA